MGAGVESQFVHAFGAVGITVGVVDGKRVGTWVGSFVGRRLGARVGVDEGVEAFAAEGVWDGCVDGVTVGSAEGPNDGCSVVHHTASEGSALGVSVGRTEGFSVGIELGSSDGVMLALAEGAKACTPVRQVSRSGQRTTMAPQTCVPLSAAVLVCAMATRLGHSLACWWATTLDSAED